MTVSAPSQMTQEMWQEYWDSRLQRESLSHDVFSALTTVMDGTSGTQKMQVPMDAVVAQLNLPPNGERAAHLGFVHALDDLPQEGDLSTQIGNEETIRTKFMNAYFNEYSHAVTGFKYGIHAHEAKPYKIYNENMDFATNLLADYVQELKGLYRRQALLERYSQNLTQSPHSLTQRWNPNWYIKNLLDSQQPTYNTNNVTFQNNIITALQTAGTGINAALDHHYMLALKNRAKQLRIEPLVIGGMKKYIFTVPSEQAVWFRSMDIAGSGGGYWKDYTYLNEKGIMFDGLIGEYDGIICVEDERAPTLTISGSAAPFTLTANYMFMGNNDQRDETATARQVGFLLGRGPLVEWEPVKVHHEYDDYNYKKWMGKGAFGMTGDQLRMYDQTTPNNASIQQHSSIVAVFARNATYN